MRSNFKPINVLQYTYTYHIASNSICYILKLLEDSYDRLLNVSKIVVELGLYFENFLKVEVMINYVLKKMLMRTILIWTLIQIIK